MGVNRTRRDGRGGRGVTVSRDGDFTQDLLNPRPLVSPEQGVGLPSLAFPYFGPQDLLFFWFSKELHFTPDFCSTQFLLCFKCLFVYFQGRNDFAEKKRQPVQSVLNVETMDAMGRLVSMWHSGPSPTGCPSEPTGFLYRKIQMKGYTRRKKKGKTT